MILRSPISAILWETWRVTRIETAWKLAIGIVGGLAVLALSAALAPVDPKMAEGLKEFGAAIAMTLLVLPHWMSWLSVASLNGGRAGFPFHLHFSRPVRTAIIVGVPMAYLAVMSSAIYLVSALLLRVTWGYAFPLLSVAAWMAALALAFLAVSWSTRSRAIQIVLMASVVTKGLQLAMDRLTAVELPDGYDWPPRLWPTLFDFPSTDYVWIALIALACFGITFLMVGRQRRGDEGAAVTRNPGAGPWGWLINLFGFRCPTSSAMRAQVWFDLKSDGLPLLTIAVALAILIFLLSVVSGPFDAAINANPDVTCPIGECFYWRTFPPLLAPISLVLVLFLARNAFGIRRRQGRTYISAFEAAQAHDTAKLALLKILAKAVCVLAAIITIGASVWVSMPVLGDAVFIQMWNVPLASRVPAVNGAVATMTGYEQLALTSVVVIGLVVWVAYLAVVAALWARYSRRANITAISLLFAGIGLALLALAESKGTVSPFVFDAVLAAMRWILLAAAVLTTIYIFWSGFAERVLTIGYACGALVISTAFGAAWLALAATGGQSAVSMLWLVLLPLMVSVLAPWSLSRLRHL